MEWKEYKEIIKEKIIKDEFISSEMLEIFNKDVLYQTDENEIIEDIRSMKNIEKKLESDSTSEKILVNKIRLLFKQLLVYLTGLSGDYYDFLQEIKHVVKFSIFITSKKLFLILLMGEKNISLNKIGEQIVTALKLIISLI